MSAPRPRLRASLVLGAVLVSVVPFVASATAPHLTCGVKQTGRWERIPVKSFPPIPGLAASQNDVVTTYSLDEDKPQEVAATNGSTVLISHTHGCTWSKGYDLAPTVTGGQPFVGANARIVSLTLLGGKVLAAVQEGSGSASRPHVLLSARKGEEGSWATSDNGLPAQGSPRLLRAASDGRTAYLTISPTASGGSDDGTTTGVIPGLPGTGGGSTTPTGFLYRTTDGGVSWTLQTGATDLPGGGTGFSHLDVDPSNANQLYGIVNGRLLVSRDAGGSFTAAPGSGYTAVTAAGAQQVVAFNGSGAVSSFNGGGTFTTSPAPAGVQSVAARASSSGVLIQTGDTLRLYEPTVGTLSAVPPPSTARTGTLLGDRGVQSSFHALAGHSLLRYVDPLPKGEVIPPIAVGDTSVPPPLPGVVSPRARNVSLPIGESSLVDFTLDLPKNPTPLDLFFLVDVSNGMSPFVEELQDKIRNIVRTLEAAKVDLKVGVGTLGTGPNKGETAFPPTYVYPPAPDPNNPSGPPISKPYVKPKLYERLRAVGDTGPDLQTAIDRIKIETAPPRSSNAEGQIIALKNLATGRGTQSEQDEASGLPTYSAVAPNQDAGWRGGDTRRIVILATNEQMYQPYGKAPMGTDTKPGSTDDNPRIDYAPTLKMLNDQRMQVIGLTLGVAEAINDLQQIAKGTRTLAPPGGVSCGGDPAQELGEGDPLVCNSADNFSVVISRVLASLVDRQSVTVVPHTRTPVLGALNGRALVGLDVKKPNTAPFQVRVSCLDVKPGVYPQDVDLVLRRTVVGRARVNVTCVKAAALTPPRPVVPDPPAAPPAQPAPNPVPPPAPPAPAPQPQPQPQVQTQVQVQPLTAAAMQEQQELQLALALNGTLKDDDPVFTGGQQMAMVDRRKREEVQALGVLAFAVVTCAGLGLAGLRARPDVRVRRVR